MSQKMIESCYFVDGASCYTLAHDSLSLLVTVLVAFFSVRYAFIQLKKQHENTISAQKEEAKRVTKIDLFKEIGGMVDTASSLLIEVSTLCLSKKYSSIEEQKILNFAEYHALSEKVISSLLSIVGKIESHEIVDLKLFRAFRFSLQSTCYDIMQLQQSNDRSAVLDGLYDSVNKANDYIYDFRICIQNLAYSDIFNSYVPYREPIDPSCKVITNDPEQLNDLIKHFLTDTEWGKNGRKYELEAKQKYHS